ncbi:DEAD/DEAH box helicase family protein [Rhizobium sp. S-51]|uniref:DEAD/DEAH box helicase family protein n=1 Tax=Rhizobium terricola TaxID=2728849 RepID=A0A7Y0AY57_9HYPH|nr:DEAD/DEAH box helicase family protein [Rhizobium terricola]NML75648.1 DEAD/DEAH box helicase family protein [Rhizobium terricola]
MNAPADFRLSLAAYQQKAVDAIGETLDYVAELHTREPNHRARIARELGVILLQAPTGSGKTLMLGRTLEAVRGKLDAKTIWFWFAPYSGLVAQTKSALAAQCGSLRLRDVYVDREAIGARDGDVFVQTWASVAVVKKESRKVRTDKEAALSIDSMIEELRERGFRIGVVIDEAHLNFGSGAAATADFYLNVLSPDYTILATATPSDAKLEKFEKDVGLKVESRVVVGRDEVVKAGLNKVGLMVGVLRFKEEDRALIDVEMATLTAGWSQHSFIKSRLAEKGIHVTPLMLVQVEDQAEGKDDPVARVRERLLEVGVPEKAIAVHTSGEPDPAFHTLAYDPQIEVLIFKVAVATGFDAPRAWTLVSVRPSRGRDFGLQIVGRIMRVHPLVRPLHGTEPLLDRGYVFLSDPELQVGLDEAAADLKAVREGIEVLTDRLEVTILGNDDRASEVFGTTIARVPFHEASPVDPVTERAERQAALGLLIPGYVTASPAQLESAVAVMGIFTESDAPPLFPDLPEVSSANSRPAATGPSADHLIKYPLRRELGIPNSLIREELPSLYDIEADLCPQIAREFCKHIPMTSLILAVNSNAELSMRDLFNEGLIDTRHLNVRMSAARIAEQAQMQLSFNDGIDPRRIREAIESELQRICQKEGFDVTLRDIRRTINLAILRHPHALREAVRVAQGLHIRLEDNEPIPEFQYGAKDAAASKKGAYGAFIGNFNRPELAFAQMLDNDDTGLVKWWIRNPESQTWATRLILPTGRRFFPDFAVGIAGRKTRHSVALVEIKDDGETGRLQSDSNTIKIRSEHSEYKKVFWTYQDVDSVFLKAVWNQSHNRIFPAGPFEIGDMVMVN